ncbi:MAG: TolC family protein [Acidobacteriia bacterium]|nr:TolC family protein [Terriglobia bacterium]
MARSAFRPSLGLSGFFNYRNLQLPLIHNWSLAGLVAQNFLDGGVKRAHLAQAQAQEAVAKANLDSLVQKVRQEVFADLSNVQVIRDKVFLTEQAEKEAEENLALAEGRYANGYGNIIELTDAQFLLTDSKVNQIAIRYEYQMAVASLDVAVGRTPVK